MLRVPSTEGRAVDTKKRLDLAVLWAVLSPAVIDLRLRRGGGGGGRGLGGGGFNGNFYRRTKGGKGTGLK